MEQKITLEMSQIAIQEPKIFLSKWYQSHKYLDMKKSQYLFYKILVEIIPHISCVDKLTLMDYMYALWLILFLINFMSSMNFVNQTAASKELDLVFYYKCQCL